MKFKKIVSSMIYGLNYDRINKFLFVKFNSGDIYMYYDVKKKDYNRLIKSSSVGQAFNSIKDNYQFTTVMTCTFPYNVEYTNTMFKLKITGNTILIYDDNHDDNFMRIDASRDRNLSAIKASLLSYGFIIE